jgi:hypothetical protein
MRSEPHLEPKQLAASCRTISSMLLLSLSHAFAPLESAPPSLADWLTAGGTVGLALLTSITLVATVLLTRSERRHAEKLLNDERTQAEHRFRAEREAADRRLRDERDHAERVRLEEREHSKQMALWSEQRTITSELITDFFSDRFLAHRIAVSKLRRKVEDGSPPIAEIACGYWYPGQFANIYRGEKLGDLDEHQHLEAYIGYVVRLAEALRLQHLDVVRGRAAIGMNLLWHIPFLIEIANETAQQAHAASARIPAWTAAVNEVHEALVVPYLQRTA